jgi:acetyltransferase-like isoleucine patch superfamily enzyme
MSREVETCQLNVTGPGNRVVWEHVQSVRNLNVTINGADNLVEMDADTRLDGVNLVITGNGNRIVLGASGVRQSGIALMGNENRVVIGNVGAYQLLDLICEDSGNEVLFGDGCEVAGHTEFIAIEGTRIVVGNGCLFSGRISIRTGDSHSVVDLEGRRINCSEDVVFGERVWVGQGVTVLKGTRVAHSSILGASAVVTRKFDTPNCVIAGNPATVVRQGIDWKVARIPCE